jgi:hypothetical protein
MFFVASFQEYDMETLKERVALSHDKKAQHMSKHHAGQSKGDQRSNL